MKKIALSLLAASLLTASISVYADNASTNVPLQVIPLGPNNYKVGITVSVAGGPPTLLTFDTGGSGLHIFKSQVGNMNIKYTNQQINSAFASGIGFHGVIAIAPVTIGNVTTVPMPVLVIDKVYCTKAKPNCGVNSDASEPSLYLGHFYGELGASMLPEVHNNNPARTLFTPFRALPGNYGTGFIIKDLSPGGTGTLVLGLNPQNTAGFNMVKLAPSTEKYPDGTTAYNDKSLVANYTIGNVSHMMHTAFDTGGDVVVNFFTGNAMGYPHKKNHIAPNQQFSAYLPQGFNWQFTTARRPGINFISIEKLLPGKGGAFVNTGLSFFFDYDVAYDFKDGQLGFMAH